MNLAGLLLLIFVIIPVGLVVVRIALLAAVVLLSLVCPPFRRHFAAKQIAAKQAGLS